MSSDPNSSQGASGSGWGLIALFATPAVIFLGWYLYSENVALKEGTYSCVAEVSLGGLFWTATVENDELLIAVGRPRRSRGH